MEIVDAREIKYALIGARFIGKGNCGFCFLTKDLRVLKIYYNSDYTRKLFGFYNQDLTGLFEFLSSFNNETFYGPDIVFADGHLVKAYIHDYAKGSLIKNINPNFTIEGFIYLFRILESYIIDASNRKLSFDDIHQKNIVIGVNIKIVDMDYCKKEKQHNSSDLAKFNFREIIPPLTKALFKVHDDYDLIFKDKTLQDLFIKAIYRDYLAYFELLECLKREGKRIKDIRKKRLIYTQKHESYYSKW